MLFLVLLLVVPMVQHGAQASLITPDDFTYIGAFRLPDDSERPDTFEYGGNAMTYSPKGDAGNSDDGYPGSLYISGHDRNEEVKDGGKVAEISIPVPGIADHPSKLPQAEYLGPSLMFQVDFLMNFSKLSEWDSHILTGMRPAR